MGLYVAYKKTTLYINYGDVEEKGMKKASSFHESTRGVQYKITARIHVFGSGHMTSVRCIILCQISYM